MVEFKLAAHKTRPVEIVEIWVDGVFRAALYPQEPNAVRLISDHLEEEPKAEVTPLGGAWRFAFHRP